jgi:hypothetical protein
MCRGESQPSEVSDCVMRPIAEMASRSSRSPQDKEHVVLLPQSHRTIHPAIGKCLRLNLTSCKS